MATTFDVIRLGKLPDMDTKDNNYHSEDASKLEGLTFGGPDDHLYEYVQEFSPGDSSFDDGIKGVYDQKGKGKETFRIDDGPEQAFDSTAVFEATITYTDGSSAQITAVVIQDHDGNSYLLPEKSQNADSDAMEAKPIESLRLDCVSLDRNISGMSADRYDTEFVTCYCPGTMIETPKGNRLIDTLKVGDMVTTQDRGAQPIRWIGRSSVVGLGNMAPIRIAKDALGAGVPQHDLWVSQQHRMVLRAPLVRQIFGLPEVMIPAKQLLGLPGISLQSAPKLVTYLHLLLPRHEVITANGSPSESLYLGPMLSHAIGRDAQEELKQVFPSLGRSSAMTPARFFPRGPSRKRYLQKLANFPNAPLVYPRPIPQPAVSRATA